MASFHANVIFLYPLKTSKHSGFVTFSGGAEAEYSGEMGKTYWS